MPRHGAGALACAGLVTIGVHAAAQAASWLDRPLENWNVAAAPLPPGGAQVAAAADVRRKCQMSSPDGAGAQALRAAGWIPVLHQDRTLIQHDVEVIAGVSAIADDCWLQDFNLFVFVGGRFAGTVSPALMTSRVDGEAGAVRFADDGIAVEFARYQPGDASCCPGARMVVRYRIERGARGPAVAPVDRRTTRSY